MCGLSYRGDQTNGQTAGRTDRQSDMGRWGDQPGPTHSWACEGPSANLKKEKKTCQCLIPLSTTLDIFHLNYVLITFN